MIEVSSEMFEVMTKRAYKIAALQFEQVAIDMPDESKSQIRDMVIEALADRILKRLGDRAAMTVAARDQTEALSS